MPIKWTRPKKAKDGSSGAPVPRPTTPKPAKPKGKAKGKKEAK